MKMKKEIAILKEIAKMTSIECQMCLNEILTTLEVEERVAESFEAIAISFLYYRIAKLRESRGVVKVTYCKQ